MVVELVLIDLCDNMVDNASLSDGVVGVVVALECVAPVSYFVKALSDVVIEAWAVGIGDEMLADVNVLVSAAVMTVLEFSMSTTKESCSC